MEKGAVVVGIHGTGEAGDIYDTKLKNQAAAATQKAMEEALIEAAKTASRSRRTMLVD